MKNIKEQWQIIWDKKYSKYKNHKWLHVQDGFDDLDYSEWQRLTHFFLDKIAIDSTDKVLDVGCGAGAFSKQIKSFKSISGVDYSADAIASIRKNIPTGEFYHSEANSLPFKDIFFDKIISFGVFFYFPNYEYATDVLNEMLKVLKSDGEIFIGDINDASKKEVAMRLRGESGSGKARKSRVVDKSEVAHLYYPVSFFEEFATNNNLSFELINESVPELSYYESSAYRYSVLLKNSN